MRHAAPISVDPRGPASASGRGRDVARSPGFTLLELLVVTVILGILAAIALPVYQGIRKRSAMSALQTELRTLHNAQELYYVENDTYTDDLSRLQYEPGEDVAVELRATAGGGGAGAGWSGRLTHDDFGVRCAYFQGSATPFEPATDRRTIACDEGG